MCVCVFFVIGFVCGKCFRSFQMSEVFYARKKVIYIACSVLLLVPAQFRWNKYGPKKK